MRCEQLRLNVYEVESVNLVTEENFKVIDDAKPGYLK